MTDKRIPRGPNHIRSPGQLRLGQQVEFWMIVAGKWVRPKRTIDVIDSANRQVRFREDGIWRDFTYVGLAPDRTGRWHKFHHLRRTSPRS